MTPPIDFAKSYQENYLNEKSSTECAEKMATGLRDVSFLIRRKIV